MKKAKKILLALAKQFIFGAHLIGLSNALMIAVALIFIDAKGGLFLIPFLSYLIIVLIYNASNLMSIASDLKSNPERTSFVAKQKKMLKLTITIYGILFLLVLLFTNYKTAIFSIFLLIMDLIYPKNVTRKIFAFKDLYITLFWSLHLFLPLFYYEVNLTLSYLYFFGFIFLRTLINVLYCDIKDIQSDKRKGLKTPAVIFGKRKVLNFLHLLNIFTVVILLLGVKLKLLPTYSLFLFGTAIYSSIYILLARKSDVNRIRYLSFTIVDGEAIGWLFFMCLGKYLG